MRRRRTYEDLPSGRVMTLEEAVAYLQAHQLPLYYDDRRAIEIWTPGTKVPISLRRSVTKYKQELLQRMHQGSVSVCPTIYHEPYWHGDICLMCAQLDRWMVGGEQYN